MSTYFDPTDASHLALLPKALREHTDLASVAALAEADVIDHFTRRVDVSAEANLGYHLGHSVFVLLRGFNPDASLVTEDGLAVGLRYTIAEVIAWRLQKLGENAAVQTSTAQGNVRVKDRAFHQRFPPNEWDKRLLRWDLRPPVYAV